MKIMKSQQFRFFLLLAFIVLAIIVSLTRGTASKETPHQSFDINIDKAITQNFSSAVLVLDITSAIFFEPSGSGFNNIVGARRWISQLDAASKDDNIKGLLVRMNSPGGSIVASQELFDAMKRFRATEKPIVVSIADICASGGYYISLPATKIIANRGSLIGSIGVRISHTNISKLLEKVGIASDEIKSVPFKDILSATRNMTPAERTHIQGLVDDMHEQFVADVITWRGEKSNPELLRQSANGLLYLSKEALEKGLIDNIGNFEEAKRLIAEEIGIPYEKLTFRKPTLLPWWENAFFPNIKLFYELENLIKLLKSISTLNTI
ncbi:putative signal peptide peptidase SppA [Spirochaetota bacterium]|nr:putative signal peptide peptidase SppA [Spirochaetota bacterium]